MMLNPVSYLQVLLIFSFVHQLLSVKVSCIGDDQDATWEDCNKNCYVKKEGFFSKREQGLCLFKRRLNDDEMCYSCVIGCEPPTENYYRCLSHCGPKAMCVRIPRPELDNKVYELCYMCKPIHHHNNNKNDKQLQ